MTTDYDTPRTTEEEDSADSLEELKARRAQAQTGAVDVDEADLAESLELPGADLSGEELTVRILPRQADEFTCTRCFLVHHRSQPASRTGNSPSAGSAPPAPPRRRRRVRQPCLYRWPTVTGHPHPPTNRSAHRGLVGNQVTCGTLWRKTLG